MTKTDFIIECAMRPFSQTEYEVDTCIRSAKIMADELEEQGYLSK